MARGSLTSILNNRRIDLEDNLKLRFTIDVTRGMRFLHSQRPPRVHRDLKSSNLLVSQQWVVKVADFGSARLVKDEGISSRGSTRSGTTRPDSSTSWCRLSVIIRCWNTELVCSRDTEWTRIWNSSRCLQVGLFLY